MTDTSLGRRVFCSGLARGLSPPESVQMRRWHWQHREERQGCHCRQPQEGRARRRMSERPPGGIL